VPECQQGELARQLQNTRFATTADDDTFLVADYPLVPTRRRFWEKVLRNTDHSGTKAQLRSQLQIVFEATRQTATASVGTVVPADFIYDQISPDLINSGELEREYNEIILKQRDGSKEGNLRSSLCALIFLIGKLPRTPGADDGVRANAETLIDLLVSDLRTDRPKLEQQIPKLSCSHSSWMPAISWRWNPNIVSRRVRVYFGRTTSTDAGPPSSMTTSASIRSVRTCCGRGQSRL